MVYVISGKGRTAEICIPEMGTYGSRERLVTVLGDELEEQFMRLGLESCMNSDVLEKEAKKRISGNKNSIS